MPERRLTKEWEVSAYDREKGEWTTAMNHSYEQAPDIKPVEATPLHFDRKRARKIGARTLLVFGDAQIGFRRINERMEPLHDVNAMNAVLSLARNLRPDVLADTGDDIDLPELGKYPKDSNHFQNTLYPAMQADHDWHARLSEATPGSERHLVDSNHAKRFGDFVLRNAGALADLPELKLHRLLRLEEAGWQFHGGYGEAEYEYADDLAIKHGTLAKSSGSTAAELAKANPDRNIIQGHAHRTESQFHTDRRGRAFGAFVVGALCRTDGIVPSFHSSVDHNNEPLKYNENWQQSVLVVRDYGEGKYTFTPAPIHNGELLFENKVYS